jgi:hypothetical protein
MVALVGWMPSAFDLSIWHSLWTVAHSHYQGFGGSAASRKRSD